MTNLQAVQVLRKNSKEFQKKGGIVIVFVLLFDGAVNTVGIQLESNWIFAVSHVFLWCFCFFVKSSYTRFSPLLRIRSKNAFKKK
jgi:hypothetical protein